MQYRTTCVIAAKPNWLGTTQFACGNEKYRIVVGAAQWLIFAHIFLLTSCSPSGPPLVRVRGTATLNGRPLAGKHIQFEPVEGTPGLGGGANTDAAGHYDVIAIRGGATVDMMGIPAGRYKVTVTEPVFPIDLEMKVQGQSRDADVAIGPPTDSPRANQKKIPIPEKYTTIESTPLEIDVSSVAETIDLNLSDRK